MDELDRAQAREEEMRADALARRKPALPAVGACYNCGEPLACGHLFCDAGCRDDWQHRENARLRAGRA